MLEHSLGTWRAPLGSPLCVPSVHGASLPRHWPHGFAPLMLFAAADYLLYFWCMPELSLLFKPNSFLVPCSSTAENFSQVYPMGYFVPTCWGLHTVHHGLTQ